MIRKEGKPSNGGNLSDPPSGAGMELQDWPLVHSHQGRGRVVATWHHRNSQALLTLTPRRKTREAGLPGIRLG